MKRIISLALLLVLALCMFSCGDDDVAPEGMKLASDTKVVDYRLYVPTEWEVSTAERATTQAYASKNDRTNILVMQWNITENTKTVADWWEKEYKPQVFAGGAVQDHKILTEGEEALLDKLPAYKYAYTGKIGDTYFKYQLVSCVTKGSIYVIQLTYMQDSREVDGKVEPVLDEKGEPVFSTEAKHKEAVDKMIGNFKFN